MSVDLSGEYLQLGASLYMPATRSDLSAIANGQRIQGLRSVIFCVEDAVGRQQVEQALDNIRLLLATLEQIGTRRFIRVRNPQVLANLLRMPGIDAIDGFVLPKITQHNLDDYIRLIPTDSSHWLMPTLESAEVFDPDEMRALRNRLQDSAHRDRILALRIGGNDLLNLLGLRRSPGSTVYDSPLRSTIAQLATIFLPIGFQLTAPVFEGLNDPITLAREVAADMEHGLFSKSAVHPHQVEHIEDCYTVSEQDLNLAQSILHESAPAVFRMHDLMCEPSTHQNWARIIMQRSEIFGVRASSVEPPCSDVVDGSSASPPRPHLPPSTARRQA